MQGVWGWVSVVSFFMMCATAPSIHRPMRVGVNVETFGVYQSDIMFCLMDSLLINGLSCVFFTYVSFMSMGQWSAYYRGM